MISSGEVNMKYLVSLVLIISVVGIALFGFAIFNHGMMAGSDGGCIASSLDGTECPTSIMDMVLHHISTFRTFLLTLAPSAASVLLLASLLVVSFIFLSPNNLFYFRRLFLFRRDRDPSRLYNQQKIISWLSLFELSPAR